MRRAKIRQLFSSGNRVKSPAAPECSSGQVKYWLDFSTSPIVCHDPGRPRARPASSQIGPLPLIQDQEPLWPPSREPRLHFCSSTWKRCSENRIKCRINKHSGCCGTRQKAFSPPYVILSRIQPAVFVLLCCHGLVFNSLIEEISSLLRVN